MPPTRILTIETSCDETAAAVITDSIEVLASVVASQDELHRRFGGVVPEIASRAHVERILPVIDETLRQAQISLDQLDAVAVVNTPGLAGSLLVGLMAAKTICLTQNIPLIAVNHLQAHIYACRVAAGREVFPCVGLIVSGGHSNLYRCQGPLDFELLGSTIDDAAGEAFDKAAKLLGLGYPGGPAIDRAASAAKRFDVAAFPKGAPRPGNPALGALRAEMCVSFSGLKTALMYRLRGEPPEDEERVAEIAAAYQEAIVAALAERSARALREGAYRSFAVGGGVSLNRRLRERLRQVADDAGVRLLLAEPRFCGDNAAMIAGLAGAGGGVRGPDALGLDVAPALETGW